MQDDYFFLICPMITERNEVSYLVSVFFDYLFMPEATFNVIIHHTGCLHVGIYNCGAYKFESSLY
jgi:hypothetical protein